MRVFKYPFTSLLFVLVGMTGLRAQPEVTQFTTQSGEEVTTTWSPDGKWIAFCADWDGNRDIWKMPVSGGDAVQLTTHRALDNTAVWSPDGSRIAFSSDRGGNGNIWTVSASGDDLKRVTADEDSVYFHWMHGSSTAWSPDGKWIAFVSVRGGSQDIWIIPADGGSARPLTRDTAIEGNMAWSGDGELIAYNASPPSWWSGSSDDIWVVPADGGFPYQLTTSPAGDGTPSWSPDGKWLAFQSDREGGYDVWVMPATGGPAYQITDFGDAYVPRWSPDGQQISFHRTPSFGGDSNIWIADASNVEDIFAEVTRQRIAGVVTSPLDGSPWSGVRIRIKSEDGGAKQRVMSGADGRYQVWVQPGSYLVRVQPSDGTAPVEVSVSAGVNADEINLTPDLATVSGRVTHPDQTRPRPWVAVHAVDGGEEEFVRTGADGRYHLWLASGTYSVAVVDGEGADPASVTLGVGDSVEDINFAPTSMSRTMPTWPFTAALVVLGIGALACVMPLVKRSELLGGVLVAPTRTLQMVAGAPDWVGPIVVVVIATLVTTVAFTGRIVSEMGGMFGGAPGAFQMVMMIAMPVVGLLGGFVATLIGWTIRTGAIWVLARIVGERANFRSLFAVVGYAYIPQLLLGSLVTAVSIGFGAMEFSMSSTPDMAVPTSLLWFLPAGTADSTAMQHLLGQIELFALWSLVITAIGVRQVYAFSMTKSAVVVAIYWIVSTAVTVGFFALITAIQESLA